MNVAKVVNNLKIRPTDRKIKKAKAFTNNVLLKEMPIEKEIRSVSKAGTFKKIKEFFQNSIDNMMRG